MANPGGRKPVTSISWNPTKSTQMVTCYDDDYSPVILVWDLRNASAPEMTLSGHSKGVLSTDWCNKDSDLLLSCGKDNRTIVWNMNSGEPIGDLYHSTNWTFDAKWCPRIPDLCAVASYDGIVGIHSIQRSSDHPPEDLFSPQPAHAEIADPDDPFSQIGMQAQKSFTEQPVFTLPQPPKWLRKPVGATFGFGATLTSFDTTSTSITLKKVPLNEEISFRSDQLNYILSENNPQITSEFCDYLCNSDFVKDPLEKEIWKMIKTLFSGNMKGEIVDFLGFASKFANDEKLTGVFKKLGIDLEQKFEDEVEQETVAQNTQDMNGDINGVMPEHENLPAVEKRPAIKAVPFSLYPPRTTDENEIDVAITKCIVIGDFETAVTICLGANRIADALILAINGGPHLIKRAQDKYFEKNTTFKSYSRVLKSVLSQDLSDIISNCKLDNNDHWKDVIGIIATYGNPEDIMGYLIKLGNRISGLPTTPSTKHSLAICYLGAAKFEKVIECWSKSITTPSDLRSKLSNIKLQSLMEKISVFQQAVQFQDPALRIDREDPDQFPLSYLYELYAEYAWLSSLNGQIDISLRFLEIIPVDYIPTKVPIDILLLRDRVYQSKGVTMAATGAPPIFPFESVEVVNYNAMILAAQQQQERIAQQQKQAPFYASGTSPSNQGYGYQTSTSHGFHQQPAQPTYQSQQASYQSQGYTASNNYQVSSFQPPNPQNQSAGYQQQQSLQPPPINHYQTAGFQPQPAQTPYQTPGYQQPSSPAYPQTTSPANSTWNKNTQMGVTPTWSQPPQSIAPPPVSAGQTGHGHSVPSTYQPPFVPPTNPYDRRTSQTSFGTSSAALGTISSPPQVPQQPPKPSISNTADKLCYENLLKQLQHLNESASVSYFN